MAAPAVRTIAAESAGARGSLALDRPDKLNPLGPAALAGA